MRFVDEFRDGDKARALADQYSVLVKTAVGGASSGSPAAAG